MPSSFNVVKARMLIFMDKSGVVITRFSSRASAKDKDLIYVQNTSLEYLKRISRRTILLKSKLYFFTNVS